MPGADVSADNITYLYGNITKVNKKQRIVEGYVSSGDVDLGGQIVDQDWLKAQLPPWVTDWGGIREQHNPMRAIGKAQSVDITTLPGPYLTAKIVDDAAWEKIEAGVYKGFSVGIKNPVIVKDAVAPNGRIVDGTLIEISTVDRPAADAAKFVLLKSATPGEWKDMQTGVVLEWIAGNARAMASTYGHVPPGSPLARAAALGIGVEGAAVKTVTPDLVKCDLSGCDCACKASAPDLDCDCQCEFCQDAREGEMAEKFAEADLYKRDVSTDERKKLARTGAAMSGGGYPIANEGDLKNAIQAFGRAKDPDATKRHIIKRAKALGLTNLLPADWSGSTKKEKTVGDTKTTVPTPDATKAPLAEDTKTPAADTTAAAAPDVEKAKAAAISHPMKGDHNHAHLHSDFGQAVSHTHAHLHDDDDVHDHPHLNGKDSRMLSPEEKRDVYAMYAASGVKLPVATDHTHTPEELANATPVDTTKAASDFGETTGAVSRPARAADTDQLGELRAAAARLEALANQTDDRDGDVDFTANQGADTKTEATDFQAENPKPGTSSPPKLELRFASVADLVKALTSDPSYTQALDAFVTERVRAIATAELVTKAAAADTLTTAADIAKMAGSLAKGLEALASRTEASTTELATLKADVEKRATALEADLAKVKELAQPPKGFTVPVSKGMLGDPDSFLAEVNKSANPTETLAAGLAQLDDNGRRDVAAALYRAQMKR